MRALDARTQRRNVRVQAHVFHLAHDLCDICLFTADAEQLVQARAELVPSDPNVRPLHIVVVCVSGHCQGEDEKQNWVDEQRERVCVCVYARVYVGVCVFGGNKRKKKKGAVLPTGRNRFSPKATRWRKATTMGGFYLWLM